MQSPKGRFIESQYNQLLLKVEPIRKEIGELKEWESNRSTEASYNLFLSKKNVFFELIEKLDFYIRLVLDNTSNLGLEDFYCYLKKCAENSPNIRYSSQKIAQDFDEIMIKVGKITAIKQEQAEIEFAQAINKHTSEQLTNDVRELKNLVAKLVQQNQMKKEQTREFVPAFFNKK